MMFLSNFAYSFLASLGFAGIFNIRGKNLIYSSIGGSIGWLFYLLCKNNSFLPAISFFVGSFAVGIYSETMARILKTPVTTFVIIGIIPLVPGGGMYYTMQKCVEGKITESLNIGFETLSIAGSIALGIILVSSTTKIIYKLKLKAKEKKLNKTNNKDICF